MAINSTSVFLGTKAAVPAMQRAGGGSIIDIPSICGIISSHANAAYPQAPMMSRSYLFIDVTAPGVAVRPPSTTKWAPVMLLARSEQRNSTVLATSSAVP